MKRLLFILPILISFIGFGQAQPPLQTIGNSGNEVRANGYLGATKGFVLRTNYSDTLSANIDSYLKWIPGIQFRSGDTIWQRSHDLTRWFRAGGGSVYTDSTNTITLAGNGSDGYPLTATLKSSSVSGNAVQVFADGIYVATSIEDGLQNGGIITWVSGYTYEISPVQFNLGGVPYTAPFTTVTLENADPDFDRLDVIAANTDGTITVITGEANDDPQKPSIDPTTQVELGFILVTANTVAPPTPPTQDWIYINNTEWVTASSTARINANSLVNPYSATKDVEGTLVQNGDNIRFTAVTPPTISDFTVLTFKIRSKAVWATDSRIGVRFYSGATPLGVEVPLSTNTFGFVSSQIVSYQIVSINLTTFGALSNVTNVLFTIRTTAGRTIGFYIDDIQLQAGEIPVSGNFWAQNGNAFGAIGTLGTLDDNAFRLITNNVERLRVLNSGHVLINKTTSGSFGQLEVAGTIMGTGLRMAAYSLSESGSTVTATTNGFSLTNSYGTNGTATHTLINGAFNINKSQVAEGVGIFSATQTQAGMGGAGITALVSNDNYPTVGTVKGYGIGTLTYNTTGDVSLFSGAGYGISLVFNNQSAANNVNSAWFHTYDGVSVNTFPWILKKTGQHIFSQYGVGSFTAGTPAYGLAVTSTGQIIEVAGGGAAYTASNGLTMVGNDAQLYGTLSKQDTINTGAFTLTISTATNSIVPLRAIATTGGAIRGESTTGTAVLGTTSGSGTGIYGSSTTGSGSYGESGTGLGASFLIFPSTTNSVDPVVRLTRTTTGTAANGIGGSIDFRTETSDGSIANASNRIESIWSDATSATRTSQFIITGVNSAVTGNILEIAGNGTVTLPGAAYVGLGAGYISVSNTGVLGWASATGSMTNPMTTAGDIIYSIDGAGTPVRLGIGSAGQVLTVTAGIPSWTTVVGTGSVTTVSVVSANGFAGTVANPTTTPAITLTTTITGIIKGNGTAISAAVAGTDYLSVLTGDATTSGNAITFATVNANVGSFGSSTSIPTFTVNAKGLITAASGNVVIAPAGTLSGTTLNATVVTSSLTTVGALASGSATTGFTLGDVTMNVTGTDATGDIYYRSSGGILTRLAIGTSGQILRVSAGGLPEYFTSAGTGTVTSIATTQPSSGFTVTGGPITTSGTLVFTLNNDLAAVEGLATTGIVRRTATNTWSAGTLVSLVTEITGTLAVLNGGTGQTSFTNGQLLIGNTTGNTLTKATLTQGNGILITNSPGAITIATTFNPTVQTLTYGATTTWNVANGGNANLTLTASGTSLVITNPVAGMTYTIKIIQGSGGNKTVGAWPSGTAWAAANGAPVLSTTAGAVDIIFLYYDGVSFFGDYKYNMVLTYFDAKRKHKIVPMYRDEENYQIAA